MLQFAQANQRIKQSQTCRMQRMQRTRSVQFLPQNHGFQLSTVGHRPPVLPLASPRGVLLQSWPAMDPVGKPCSTWRLWDVKNCEDLGSEICGDTWKIVEICRTYVEHNDYIMRRCSYCSWTVWSLKIFEDEVCWWCADARCPEAHVIPRHPTSVFKLHLQLFIKTVTCRDSRA